MSNKKSYHIGHVEHETFKSFRLMEQKFTLKPSFKIGPHGSVKVRNLKTEGLN